PSRGVLSGLASIPHTARAARRGGDSRLEESRTVSRHHGSARGRATLSAHGDATDRPRRSVLTLGLKESHPMQPRVPVVPIGVDDLEQALRFYRDGLGLATEGIIGREFSYGAVVFIALQAGVRLALWPRRSIAHDAGLSLGATSPTEFTLGH